MNEEVSLQLVHQRIRNRIAEALGSLAEGDSYNFDHGAAEYFEAFFDWMPLEDQAPLTNMVMTAQELAAVEGVRALMLEACNATPQHVTVDELISSGWPGRIAGPAAAALELLEARGRFSEWAEEGLDALPRRPH